MAKTARDVFNGPTRMRRALKTAFMLWQASVAGSVMAMVPVSCTSNRGLEPRSIFISLAFRDAGMERRGLRPSRNTTPLRQGHEPKDLVALMNSPKIRNSSDALSAAAKRLGIKRDSLKSILSRKGIRRTGRRYVGHQGGRTNREQSR